MIPDYYGRLLNLEVAERVALAAIRSSRLVRVTPYPDGGYLVEVRAPENTAWLDAAVLAADTTVARNRRRRRTR